MRLRVVVTMLALVFAGVATAADGSVTIDGRIVLAPTTRAEFVRLTGTIASARAGERIEILAKECGYDHYRVVSGTQSTPGGRWQVEVPLTAAASLVARWRGRRSVPFTATPKAVIWITRTEGTRRWQASISAFLTTASFVGREVELQRLGDAGWVRVRRAKLRRAEFGSYSVTFVIPTRGLTMRVVAPERTTRPCFRAGASEIFRS